MRTIKAHAEFHGQRRNEDVDHRADTDRHEGHVQRTTPSHVKRGGSLDHCTPDTQDERPSDLQPASNTEVIEDQCEKSLCEIHHRDVVQQHDPHDSGQTDVQFCSFLTLQCSQLVRTFVFLLDVRELASKISEQSFGVKSRSPIPCLRTSARNGGEFLAQVQVEHRASGAGASASVPGQT
eukprot:CAMPEP_0115696162 /NCGR_PEP_ID=MMETSP0272-20121206/65138_1 /TAXON_ID=71861 /ORGANISM="Scrippsiella trochoidea, Strain CCMP3099" /LENGTH=179 /DNA_ID=CAMNT_0003136381 /DNA_START=218 /DNA_END=757 /DNA_ORIENTATION=+